MGVLSVNNSGFFCSGLLSSSSNRGGNGDNSEGVSSIYDGLVSEECSCSRGVSSDTDRDGVSVGYGMVSDGVASVDMRGSISEDRGFDSLNFDRLSGFDNRSNCVVDKGNMRESVSNGCSDNSGSNGVNETILVVILRESLKSNVCPSPLGGSQSTNSGMNRPSSGSRGQILIQWTALAYGNEGRQANENFHDDVVYE